VKKSSLSMDSFHTDPSPTTTHHLTYLTHQPTTHLLRRLGLLLRRSTALRSVKKLCVSFRSSGGGGRAGGGDGGTCVVGSGAWVVGSGVSR